MEKLECHSTFRIYEPLEEYRSTCPRVLIVCSGPHIHPIPSPLKTPPTVRHTIFRLLSNLGQDLADITPRRFLWHPNVRSYLKETFPHKHPPTLSDLHISLSNQEHLQSYLDQAKMKAFPESTGWGGEHDILRCILIVSWSHPNRSLTSETTARPSSTQGGDVYPFCNGVEPSGVCDTWGRWTKRGGRWCSLGSNLHEPREQLSSSGSSVSPKWYRF